MSHIVILVGSYYPDFQAVGICVRNIVNELKIDNEITIISKKSSFKLNFEDEFNGVKINRIQTKSSRALQYLDQKIKTTKGAKKIFYKLCKDFFRTLRLFKVLNSNSVLYKDEVEAYSKKLNEINKKKRVEVVIPCASPFETCIASIQFKQKNKGIKLVPYMFDHFSNNDAIYRHSKLLRYLKFKNHVKLEKLLYDNSDVILCMKHYINSQKLIHKGVDKFIAVEHPLLLRSKADKSFEFNKDKLIIVYTGVLYKKIRNPEYAFTIISELMNNKSNIELHIFGSGDCYSIIHYYQSIFPNQIKYHGHVNSEIAESARENCDILLSIGNISNNQLPSKTFEYMSAMKPIIHFSSNKTDDTISILRRYPSSCILFEDSIRFRENLVKLEEFLKTENKIDSFDQLEKIFFDAVPSYTSEKILRYLQ